MNPSPNGGNGRDDKGRFLPGNGGGPGNPLAKRSNELRSMLLAAVTEADLAAVVKTLVDQARAGEPWAVKEFMDRVMGRPLQSVDLDVSGGGGHTLVVNYHVVQPDPADGRTVDASADG